MNMSQINIDPETDEEAIGDDHEWMNATSNNRYNLRPRLTKGTIGIPCYRTVNNQL